MKVERHMTGIEERDRSLRPVRVEHGRPASERPLNANEPFLLSSANLLGRVVADFIHALGHALPTTSKAPVVALVANALSSRALASPFSIASFRALGLLGRHKAVPGAFTVRDPMQDGEALTRATQLVVEG